MRWNRIAAVCVLQAVLALLGLWQFGYTAMMAARRPEAAGLLADLGSVGMIVMVIVPGVWTWRVLLKSNAPFQKKPGLTSVF